MSTFTVVELIDESLDIPFNTDKSTNLNAIRTRFLKYGNPPGTMKLQILNEAKDTVLAESNSLNCDYATESDYVGTDDDYNMSWIKFDFDGEAIKTSTNYYLRVLPDSTYFAGRDDSNHLNVIVDYPKPTNDNDSPTLEDTHGRNFSRYPRAVLQVFGRDYG